MERKQALTAATVAMVLAGGVAVATLGRGPGDAQPGPPPADAVAAPVSASPEPSADPSGTPKPETVPEDEGDDESAGSTEDAGDEESARDTDDAVVFESPAALCDQVSASEFADVTGIAVTRVVRATELQCDYVQEDAPDFFARVTARVPEGFTSWDDYVVAQPDGDQVSHPEVGDGAIVIVVEAGEGLQYVTAEVGVGQTVVTWELALTGPEAQVREDAAELLAAVAGDEEG